jgi:hypothetical protein
MRRGTTKTAHLRCFMPDVRSKDRDIFDGAIRSRNRDMVTKFISLSPFHLTKTTKIILYVNVFLYEYDGEDPKLGNPNSCGIPFGTFKSPKNWMSVYYSIFFLCLGITVPKTLP